MTWEELKNILFELFKTVGIKLLVSAVIFIVGAKLIKLLKRWIENSRKMDKLEHNGRKFISTLIGILLYIALFITIAMILGIPTASFVAALASACAAIGLAMQGALSNLAGGIILLIFKPFKEGDYINIPGESAEGTVKEVSLFYTILSMPDNTEVTVPNGTMMNSVIKNSTTAETRRVDLTFTTSYDSDIDLVEELLRKVLLEHPLTLKDPAPFARLSAHGDSALVFSARAWCNTADYWQIKFDILKTVKEEFDKNGISIPYPQLDVHLDKNEK